VRQVFSYPVLPSPPDPWQNNVIATDEEGGIYVWTRFAAIAPSPTSHGWANITKFSEDGSLEWSKDLNKDIGIGNEFPPLPGILRATPEGVLIVASNARNTQEGDRNPCYLICLNKETGNLNWAKAITLNFVGSDDNCKFEGLLGINSVNGNIYLGIKYYPPSNFSGGESPGLVTLSSNGSAISAINLGIDSPWFIYSQFSGVLTKADGSIIAYGTKGIYTGGTIITSDTKGYIIGLSGDGSSTSPSYWLYGSNTSDVDFTSGGILLSNGDILLRVSGGEDVSRSQIWIVDPSTGEIKTNAVPYHGVSSAHYLQELPSGEIMVAGWIFGTGKTVINNGWRTSSNPQYPSNYFSVYSSDLSQITAYREVGINPGTFNESVRSFSTPSLSTGRYVGAPQYRTPGFVSYTTPYFSIVSTDLSPMARRYATLPDYTSSGYDSYVRFASATTNLPVSVSAGSNYPPIVTLPSPASPLSANAVDHASSIVLTEGTIVWAFFQDDGGITCDTLPFECDIDVNPYCETDFGGAWANCTSITSFPFMDVGSGTDFESAWSGCSNMSSFPSLDVSSGTNFRYTWKDCSSLSSFPQLHTGSGTDFSYAWQGCSALTTFPSLDVSSGTKFSYTWSGCSTLTSFPLLDVSSGTWFFGAWSGCSNLTSFPVLDVSSGTYFDAAWRDCSSLTSFPFLDLSSGINFIGTWKGCSSLTSFPPNVFDDCTFVYSFEDAWKNCALSEESVDNILVSLDASGLSNNTTTLAGGTSAAPGPAGLAAKASLEAKGWTVYVNGAVPCDLPPYYCDTNVNPNCVTDFSDAWKDCDLLTSFPEIDVSSGTNFYRTWYGCQSLTSFPTLNVSSGTNFNTAWALCFSLTSFPLLDTSSGTNFLGAWGLCQSLTSFPALDFSSGTNFELAWYNCTSLTSFPYIDMGSGTNFEFAWAYCENLSSFPANVFDNCSYVFSFEGAWEGCALDQTSVDNILISLDVSGLLYGSTSLAEGTSAAPGPAGLSAKASLVSKGWTIATN